MNILVTGCSTGIGFATVQHLVQMGFTVFASARKESDLEKLQRLSPLVHPVILDVTRSETIESARAEIESKTGGVLHGLVNNAGIALGGPLEFFPLAELRKQFDVNVFGLIEVTQKFLPLLRRGVASRGRGKVRIVNISSVSGLVAWPLMGPYCGSKFALEAMSDSLRMELYGAGIHVSLIEPGVTATAIWENSQTSAQQITSQLPEAAETHYGAMMKRLMGITMTSGPKGVHPASIARIVGRALTSPFPKARYFAGGISGAIQKFILSLLPKPVSDRIFAALIGTSRG